MASRRASVRSFSDSLRGRVHEHRSLFLCLANGEVCGSLREHESAADAVVVLLGRPVGDRALCALGPVGKLAHLLLQLLDRYCDLLEELVHLIGVVAPKAGTKLNLSQEFCRQIHARMVSVAREKMVDAAGRGPKQPLTIKMTIQTMIGERSTAVPPTRSGGTMRRTGRSTGSVIASKNRVIGTNAEPGGAGM